VLNGPDLVDFDISALSAGVVLSNTSITRRDLFAGAAAQALTPARRPNLLFILADDHAGYVLGCDGNPLARTPNLDHLAQQSTRFAAHHCNSPVCTPSRQSFFTGQLPHMAGVTRLPTPLGEDKPTLARQLKKAGYTTAVFGKMHFNMPAKPGLHGFDFPVTENELTRAWNQNVKARSVPNDVSTKPPWHPFKDPARIWLNADKFPYPRFERDMRSLYQLQLAEQFLTEHRDKPFAMWLSFMEPHSPYDFPVEDRTRFDPARFNVPRVGPQDGPQIPLIFRDLTDKDKQGIAASYYTSVEYLDRNVGRALATLKRLGLERDTLVVYMADHGYSLGQHGRFEKHCGYDPALRVPLLMRFPGRIRQGIVKDMTEHIDVPATLVDLLNLDPLPIQHGQSLRPYLEGRRMDQPRDWIFSEYLENEEAYVRSHRWKFIFCSGKRKRTDGYETDNPTPGRYIRLFDLEKDPGEFADVSAANPATIQQLGTLMLTRFRATHPDAPNEPQRLSMEESLEFYVRPRDV
jgi:choline-sulfatase